MDFACLIAAKLFLLGFPLNGFFAIEQIIVKTTNHRHLH